MKENVTASKEDVVINQNSHMCVKLIWLISVATFLRN